MSQMEENEGLESEIKGKGEARGGLFEGWGLSNWNRRRDWRLKQEREKHGEVR